MKSSDSDFKIRKAIAWGALNQMFTVWTLNWHDLKEKMFLAIVESVRIYGCEAWAITA